MISISEKSSVEIFLRNGFLNSAHFSTIGPALKPFGFERVNKTPLALGLYGKSGHAATRCPNLNDSFPFMQPGWRAEKTPGGDASGRKCPCAEQNRHRPSDVSA